jgi:hypothetical protein
LEISGKSWKLLLLETQSDGSYTPPILASKQVKSLKEGLDDLRKVINFNEVKLTEVQRSQENKMTATSKALPKLTRLEMDVLAGCYASNYTDGYESFAIWSWSMEPMITTEKQRAGVVSSLVKKGIVTCGGSGSKDDDNTIDVTSLGIKVARHLGIYNDETGYDKDVHASLVGYNVGPANTNEDVSGGDKAEDTTQEVLDVIATATDEQITKAVDKVMKNTAKGGPVILSAKEAASLLELLGTAKSINRDYLKFVTKSRRSNGTEDYIERFEAGRQTLINKGAK